MPLKPLCVWISCFLLLQALLFAAAPSAVAAAKVISAVSAYKDNPEAQHQKAAAYYSDLQRNPALGKKREAWLSGAQTLERISRKYPKHRIAPVCLLLAAQMHQNMEQRFGQAADLDQAMALFDEVASQFPRSGEADDALYALAEIEQAKGNLRGAAQLYYKIVWTYPGGNRKKQAEEQLRQLRELAKAFAAAQAARKKPADLKTVFPDKVKKKSEAAFMPTAFSVQEEDDEEQHEITVVPRKVKTSVQHEAKEALPPKASRAEQSAAQKLIISDLKIAEPEEAAAKPSAAEPQEVPLSDLKIDEPEQEKTSPPVRRQNSQGGKKAAQTESVLSAWKQKMREIQEKAPAPYAARAQRWPAARKPVFSELRSVAPQQKQQTAIPTEKVPVKEQPVLPEKTAAVQAAAEPETSTAAVPAEEAAMQELIKEQSAPPEEAAKPEDSKSRGMFSWLHWWGSEKEDKTEPELEPTPVPAETGQHEAEAPPSTAPAADIVAAQPVEEPKTVQSEAEAGTSATLPEPKTAAPAAEPKKEADFAEILPVQYWASDNYSRVAVNVSAPAVYHVTLPDKTSGQPGQLRIDFERSRIASPGRPPIAVENGLLQRIRADQFDAATVRVVLDVDAAADCRVFSLNDPFRVVVDVRSNAGESSATTMTVAEQSGLPAASSEQEKKDKPKKERIALLKENKKTKPLTLAQQLGLGVRRIVIDPGHGGKDPGAMAVGLQEKQLVLAVAKKVRRILRQDHGYEVLLTRDKDVFLPLEERIAVANANSADLFLSIHVNAHPQAAVKGVETFYLNLATNPEAMRVAALENAVSTHSISEMEDILAELMKNTKINESSQLAQCIQTSMVDGLQDQQYQIRNLGVKQAPFYVLIGAQMPAALAEISFLSNPDEARLLKDGNYLQAIAEQIAAGVVAYIDHRKVAPCSLPPASD